MARRPGFRSSEACFLKNYKSATGLPVGIYVFILIIAFVGLILLMAGPRILGAIVNAVLGK